MIKGNWFAESEEKRVVEEIPRGWRRLRPVQRRSRAAALALLLAMAVGASGTTYQVGPTQAVTDLQSVSGLLAPGDVVEVEGDTTYPGGIRFNKSGTAESPITIHGIRVNGNRPALRGLNGFTGGSVMRVSGSHYVVEGFDFSMEGDPSPARACFRNVGDGTVLRDSVVHDSPCDGVAGSDVSGSLTLEYVEVYRCGLGGTKHQIYVGSSNSLYPGAIFRMQFCYVHDGGGGNNVKSRVGRNEIYYNWIEGATYHELDLIGADRAAQPGLADAVREDSDVVGNVFVKREGTKGNVARVGGDGTGISKGRYRFVNNTVIVAAPISIHAGIFKLQDALESLEMHNNVFDHAGLPVRIMVAGSFASARSITGSRNWIPTGSASVPAGWTNTLTADRPRFIATSLMDYAPAITSPLIDASATPTQSPAEFPFPSPLPAPLYLPAVHGLYDPVVGPTARPTTGVLDIGAFEHPAEPAGNAAPVAGDDAELMSSNRPITIAVLTNDFDPEGAPLSVVGVTQGATGSVKLNGDVVTYTSLLAIPVFDFFTYDVTDGYRIATARVTTFNPFVPARGNYNGLIANGVPANSGFFKLTAAPTGGFTAILRYGGFSYSMKGLFDLNGNWTKTITWNSAPPLLLTLHLDLTGGTHQVTGTVFDGVTTAALTAGRAAYDLIANPAPQAGYYTLLLPANPADTAPEFPQGNGYATIFVNASGLASATIKLGDGAVVTASGYLVEDGTVPIYATPYTSPAGRIAGTLTFRDLPDSDCDGALAWEKPAQSAPATGVFGTAGFSTTIDAVGSRYIAPPPGSPVLQVAVAIGNAELRLGEGNLPTPITKTVTIWASSAVAVTAPMPELLTMTITTSSGVFSGKFLHPADGNQRTFQGVILQKRNVGAGLFGGVNNTGYVELLPH